MSFLRAKNSPEISDPSDIVSALIRCPADKSYILAYHPNNDYYLPHLPLKNRTWGSACSELLLKYLGEDVPSDRLIRINRIWHDDNKPFLVNAVYQITVAIEHKNKMKLPDHADTKEKIMWMKLNEVLRLLQLEMLNSPEMKVYFSQGSGDYDMKILKEIADVTGAECFQISESIVTRGTLSYIEDSYIV